MRMVGYRKGQALVEFTLVLPIFLLLLFGIVEFGRAYMAKNIITGAAREAVRLAVVQTDFTLADNAAKTRVTEVLNSAGIYAGFATIVNNYDAPEPRIEVIVNYQFTALLQNFIPGWSGLIPLQSTTSMRRERF